MTNGTNECYDCKKRRIGCHSGCDSYLEFRQLLDDKARDSYGEMEYYDYLAKAVSRMRGKKIKGKV